MKHLSGRADFELQVNARSLTVEDSMAISDFIKQDKQRRGQRKRQPKLHGLVLPKQKGALAKS